MNTLLPDFSQATFEAEQPVDNQYFPYLIRSYIKPVLSLENNELIGYVRVSESLKELRQTLRRLDYGLGSGIAIALLSSSIGSIWLIRRAMGPIESSFKRG